MFAGLVATVVNSPKFWALSFWVPLTECIAMRINAFFGARPFFVAAGAAKHGVKFMLFD